MTDRAGVLAPDAAARLERQLVDFERETSNQFLVYTERTLPEGTTLEEYTVASAQAWKAGQTQRKNGMILFVFPGSRKARLEVGYGLEGAMPDALARRVLDEQVLPRFRAGDYSGGISAGVSAAIAATKGEYAGTGRSRGQREGGRGGAPSRISPFLILILVILGFVFSRRWRLPFFYIGGGGWGSGGGGSFGGGGASGSW